MLCYMSIKYLRCVLKYFVISTYKFYFNNTNSAVNINTFVVCESNNAFVEFLKQTADSQFWLKW